MVVGTKQKEGGTFAGRAAPVSVVPGESPALLTFLRGAGAYGRRLFLIVILILISLASVSELLEMKIKRNTHWPSLTDVTTM